jgi:hypothetical protein
MANFTTSELLTRAVAVSATMNAGIQKGELRGNMNGALSAIIDSTPDLIMGGQATITELKTRPDHLVRVPVLKRTTRTVGSTRTCATSTTQDDSALVTPTWTTVTDGGFRVNLSTTYGNMYSFEQQFANSYKQSLRILHEKLSLDTLTFYEANKATIAGQVGNLNTFNVLNGQMQTTLANKDNFFGFAYAEMMQNRYSGPYTNVHTLGQMNFEIARQTAQGAGNSTNLAWQTGLGWNHYGEQQFTGASGTTGSAYIFVPGTVGLLNWTRPDFRAGINLGEIEVWTTIPDPIYPGIEWEMKIKRSCGDGNSGNTGGVGYENSELISFELSADFSRLARYTSTAGDTGIMKYAQMSA